MHPTALLYIYCLRVLRILDPPYAAGFICPWPPGAEQDPQVLQGHAGCWLCSMQGQIPAWPSHCLQPCRGRSHQLGLLQAVEGSPLSTRTLKAPFPHTMTILLHSATPLTCSMILFLNSITPLCYSMISLPHSMALLPLVLGVDLDFLPVYPRARESPTSLVQPPSPTPVEFVPQWQLVHVLLLLLQKDGQRQLLKLGCKS